MSSKLKFIKIYDHIRKTKVKNQDEKSKEQNEAEQRSQRYRSMAERLIQNKRHEWVLSVFNAPTSLAFTQAQIYEFSACACDL